MAPQTSSRLLVGLSSSFLATLLLVAILLLQIGCCVVVVDAFSSSSWSDNNNKARRRLASSNNYQPTITTAYSAVLLKAAAAMVEEEEIITIVEDDKTSVDHEDDHDADELVDSITEKIEEMEGLWYSDDFYGPHGREWVKISAKLVGETATSALVAVKVTGDPNVPAGCETFKTTCWPTVGGGKVPASIQIRSDPKDPNGFSWLPGELTLITNDEIRLMCQYNIVMKSEGTFYKQQSDEGEQQED